MAAARSRAPTVSARAVASFDEVLVTKRRPLVGQPFAEAEKAALRRARSLIAQFPVADLGDMHPPRKLTSDAISVECLKGK